MGTETETQPDDSGGGESPFRATADYDATAVERYQETIDVWIVSPMKVLWSDYRGRIGLSILVFYILMGTVGVLLIERPTSIGGPRLLAPFQSLEYPLGTDGLNQDMLALMVHATPEMFKMMIAGALFANLLGVVVGLLSGYRGGNTDKVLMTISDTVMSIPALPLLLVLVALIEPTNPYLIGIILNIQGWSGLARSVRSQVLPLRNKEYVEASSVMGQADSAVLTKHILPELAPYVTIGFMNGATGIIHASVGLYFLGVLPFTNLNWGVVLNQAYYRSGALYSLDVAHWLLVPLVTISLLTYGLTLLAQAFDQVFNPRVRARHEARSAGSEDDEPEPEEVTTQQIGMKP